MRKTLYVSAYKSSIKNIVFRISQYWHNDWLTSFLEPKGVIWNAINYNRIKSGLKGYSAESGFLITVDSRYLDFGYLE